MWLLPAARSAMKMYGFSPGPFAQLKMLRDTAGAPRSPRCARLARRLVILLSSNCSARSAARSAKKICCPPGEPRTPGGNPRGNPRAKHRGCRRWGPGKEHQQHQQHAGGAKGSISLEFPGGKVSKVSVSSETSLAKCPGNPSRAKNQGCRREMVFP